jgi:hypothetical protein
MKLFAIMFFFVFAANAGQEIKIQATGKNQNERHHEATPDLIELLVDIDPKAYGYRAGSHKMAVNLTADPFVNGRLSLDYQLKLNNYLKLIFPVSFEHSALAATPINPNPRITNQWSLIGGVGIKLRLSEWMAKSSFYIEFLTQAGIYSQEAKGFGDARQAIRIRPTLFAGWERMFETGLVVGVKAGVEYNWDIITGSKLPFAENRFNFVPAITAGYAW